MHQINFPPTDVYFPTQTSKQEKPPSLSAVPTIQFGQAVTNIDSIVSWVQEIITKVIVFAISGDPMYLIEGTPDQTHQAKIDSLRKPSNTKMFFVNVTIQLLRTNTSPKKTATTTVFGPH